MGSARIIDANVELELKSSLSDTHPPFVLLNYRISRIYRLIAIFVLSGIEGQIVPAVFKDLREIR